MNINLTTTGHGKKWGSVNLWERVLGIFLTIGGGALLGSAVVRQSGTVPGEHPFSWMVIGVLVATVGFVVLMANRNRSKPS